MEVSKSLISRRTHTEHVFESCHDLVFAADRAGGIWVGYESFGFIVEGSRVVGNTAATFAGGIYVQVLGIQTY